VTGIFAAVARVTRHRWVCLATNEEINFGLQPGGELKVETTICHEVRQNRAATIIEHVAEDEVYWASDTGHVRISKLYLGAYLPQLWQLLWYPVRN
jgi:hypothetical protein